MKNKSKSENTNLWKQYYEKKGLKPSPTLKRALEHFTNQPPEIKTAIDLGCGNGRDTFPLLEAGWLVYAIDALPDAIEMVKNNTDKTLASNLRLECLSFEKVDWHAVTFVNASLALPFCNKSTFDEVCQKMIGSILPKGLFSGHFFGINDDWKNLSLVNRNYIEKLFEGFEMLHFNEAEYDRESATGPLKHWHIFEVTAIKR